MKKVSDAKLQHIQNAITKALRDTKSPRLVLAARHQILQLIGVINGEQQLQLFVMHTILMSGQADVAQRRLAIYALQQIVQLLPNHLLPEVIAYLLRRLEDADVIFDQQYVADLALAFDSTGLCVIYEQIDVVLTQMLTLVEQNPSAAAQRLRCLCAFISKAPAKYLQHWPAKVCEYLKQKIDSNQLNDAGLLEASCILLELAHKEVGDRALYEQLKLVQCSNTRFQSNLRALQHFFPIKIPAASSSTDELEKQLQELGQSIDLLKTGPQDVDKLQDSVEHVDISGANVAQSPGADTLHEQLVSVKPEVNLEEQVAPKEEAAKESEKANEFEAQADALQLKQQLYEQQLAEKLARRQMLDLESVLCYESVNVAGIDHLKPIKHRQSPPRPVRQNSPQKKQSSPPPPAKPKQLPPPYTMPFVRLAPRNVPLSEWLEGVDYRDPRHLPALVTKLNLQPVVFRALPFSLQDRMIDVALFVIERGFVEQGLDVVRQAVTSIKLSDEQRERLLEQVEGLGGWEPWAVALRELVAV